MSETAEILPTENCTIQRQFSSRIQNMAGPIHILDTDGGSLKDIQEEENTQEQTKDTEPQPTHLLVPDAGPQITSAPDAGPQISLALAANNTEPVPT